MRHSVVGSFAGLLLWACVSDAPKGEILSLSPSSVTASDMRVPVLIKGRGLGDFARLKLEDKDSARITPVTVEVGGELAIVMGRPSRDEIRAEFPSLPPGDHDVRVLAGSEVSAELVDAFRVEADPTAGNSGTGGTTSSATNQSDATGETRDTPSDSDETSLQSSSRDEHSSTESETTSANGSSSDAISASDADVAMSEATDADAGMSELFDASTGANPTDTASSQTSDDTTPDAQTVVAECAGATGTLLFYEDYEAGDFANWTFDDNVGQDSCQTTEVTDTRVFEGALSLSSTLTCAPGSEAEHYVALQFDGDELLSGFDETVEGIDAPLGVVISFDVWADLGFAAGADAWLSFVLLSGSCDWSDVVLSVATPGEGEHIGISHGDVNGGREYDYGDAPVAARAEWTRVTIYVNYYEQVLSVWQDGVLASRAEFVRPGNTLCHIWLGAGFGPDSVDSQVYQDNVMVWRLSEALADPDVEPCLVDEDYWRGNWTNRWR